MFKESAGPREPGGLGFPPPIRMPAMTDGFSSTVVGSPPTSPFPVPGSGSSRSVGIAAVDLRSSAAGPGSADTASGSDTSSEAAAEGATNRQAATALRISVKTVEARLTRIYRRLGIQTRTQLARHVGT